MGIAQKIIDLIVIYENIKNKRKPGDLGKFWQDGGVELLYDLPIKTNNLVIDGGGYRGEWTAAILSRYGCRVKLYEPVPEFSMHCESLFKDNQLVEVFRSALGGSNRKSNFRLDDNSTTEYSDVASFADSIEAHVIDIAEVLNGLTGVTVGCIKLNIEGGEYEVLERLIQSGTVEFCNSFLIQFHRQPIGYEARYRKINESLERTHTKIWGYEMIWEKWVRKDLI
jgi:FkbM family methyltransferase